MKIHATSTWWVACLLLCVIIFPRTGMADDTHASLLSKPEGEAKASMETMQIPSHGSSMNALVYVAAGAGPHPAVILLHGFPGNERNLDLAQDMRRAGWDVLYFNYRGTWGSPGDFSFTHGIEDVGAAVEYIRLPMMSQILRLDPSRVVLIGHSMGGFMAVEAAAADPTIAGVGLLSADDIGGRIPRILTKDQ